MSIVVALEDLVGEVDRRGPGYLLTTTVGGRPHVMHQRFTVAGSTLTTGAGRTASRNIGDEPAVTLLWPPEEPGGYSLVVDGTAEVVDQRVIVTPLHAVLHRPA